jgi:division protein CdvB (Snf7/Vps24/ESCRT-III family)
MAEITYRELLATIARLVAATNAEAQAAEQRRTRIEAKAREANVVVGRLTELDFDDNTKRDVKTIADNFVGQARGAVAAANAARDLNVGAQDAADTVQKNHGGIHSAVNSASVPPAKREAYNRL